MKGVSQMHLRWESACGKKDVKIDVFISSPAKRAKKTAEYFIKEFDGKEDDFILVSALYDAGTNNFSETIKGH